MRVGRGEGGYGLPGAGRSGIPLLEASLAWPPAPSPRQVLTTIISVGMGKRSLCMYRALSSFTSTRKAPLMRAKMSEAMLVWGRFLQMSMKVWGRQHHAHGLAPFFPDHPTLGCLTQ